MKFPTTLNIRFFTAALSLVASTTPCLAQFVTIDSTSFSQTTLFNELSGDVEWEDGVTVNGVYLLATNAYENADANGVPTIVPASFGSNSSGQAYHMGIPGDPDRALGWINTSATQRSWTGIQYRNQSGEDFLEINYRFVLEQWGQRNTSSQDFLLQYKVTSSGGGTNILNSTSWTTLDTATTPVIGSGSAPWELNGNEHQIVLEGTFSLLINNGQFLTFRLIDENHPGGDAMMGIESISLSIGAPFEFFTGHGTPYTWLDQYFDALVNPSDYEAADLSDPDGDRIPSWEEYLAGTNPIESDRLVLAPNSWNETDDLGYVWGYTDYIGYSLSMGFVYLDLPYIHSYRLGWLYNSPSVPNSQGDGKSRWFYSWDLGWIAVMDDLSGNFYYWSSESSAWALASFME